MVEDRERITAQAAPPYLFTRTNFSTGKCSATSYNFISWCYPATGIYKHQQAEDLRTGKRTKEDTDTIELFRSVKVPSPRALISRIIQESTALCNNPGRYRIRRRTPALCDLLRGKEHRTEIFLFSAVTSDYFF